MTDSHKLTLWLIPVLGVLGDMAVRDLRQGTKVFWFKSIYFN